MLSNVYGKFEAIQKRQSSDITIQNTSVDEQEEQLRWERLDWERKKLEAEKSKAKSDAMIELGKGLITCGSMLPIIVFALIFLLSSMGHH